MLNKMGTWEFISVLKAGENYFDIQYMAELAKQYAWCLRNDFTQVAHREISMCYLGEIVTFVLKDQ